MARGAVSALIGAGLFTLSSGALVHYFGWKWVNLGAVPLLVFASAVTLWYSGRQRLAAA